jgi:hypothetical protein
MEVFADFICILRKGLPPTTFALDFKVGPWEVSALHPIVRVNAGISNTHDEFPQIIYAMI